MDVVPKLNAGDGIGKYNNKQSEAMAGEYRHRLALAAKI